MATITSGNFEARSGTISIDITHASLPSTTVKVSDIGTIEADFDLSDDEEKANNVLFNLGEFNFKCFDSLGNGGSLFEELDTIDSTETITVTIDGTLNSGRSFTGVFSFTTNNIEYNYIRREVSIESVFDFSLTADIAEIVGSNCSEVVLVSGYNEQNDPNNKICSLSAGTGEIHAMTAKGFVNEILSRMNTNNIVKNGSYLAGGTVATGSNQFFVLNSDSTTTSYTADDPAQPLFYRMAVADGAIIGSFMGYNFFVQRKDTTNSVTLETSEVEDLSIETSLENYFGIRVGYLSILNSSLTGNPYDGMGVHKALLGGDDGLNSEATKYTNIYFESTQLANANDSTGSWVDDSRTLRGNAGSLDEKAFEGDDKLVLQTAPPAGLAVGDSVFPSVAYDRAYEVSEINSNVLVLNEPLREDIEDTQAIGFFTDMTAAEGVIADRSTEGYKLGYNAGEGRRVQLTIHGLDNLKPFESFTLGTSFSSLLSGGEFRPSKLEYDLQTDKITVEAYQIA